MPMNDQNKTKGLKDEHSRFLSIVSHEIRTPLNAISGMSQLLADTELTSTQKQFVDTIQRAGGHLLSMIDNLLDVAKFESGELVLDEDRVEIDTELRMAMAEVQPLADEKGLSLSIHTTSDITGIRILDRRRLRQCLSNLLSNAVKFTDKGGVELTAMTSDAEFGKGGNLVVTITDSGPGIALKEQQHVFELFRQNSAGIKRDFDGAGLGLPITRMLSRKMGGDLVLSSTPGKGTSTVLSIAYSCPKQQSVRETTLRGNVLVVEDNRTNQRLLQLVLDKLGHDCAIAENGKVGMELFEAQDFDMVLMDLHMPVMDGFECTAAIRTSGHKNADLPIIALTADVRPGIEERVGKAGMDAYLAKPFELPQLAAMIRSALMVSHDDKNKADQKDVSPDARTQTG